MSYCDKCGSPTTSPIRGNPVDDFAGKVIMSMWLFILIVVIIACIASPVR